MRRAIAISSAFLWIAGCAFAQEKPAPSPEIDQALRERAALFMQYTVDRAYRKAYELVAEDSKDWYFSAGHAQYTKFKIEGIEYQPDFQHATVKTRVTRVLSMNGHDMPAETLVEDLWNLVDGKWMWVHDPDVIDTPLGRIKRTKVAEDANSTLPKDMGPEATQDFDRNIKNGGTLSKDQLTFDSSEESLQEVVFHNGFPGVVSVSADIVGDYRIFSVFPLQMDAAATKDIVFRVSHKAGLEPAVAATYLRVRIEPFNRTMMLPLKLR